MVPSTVTWYVPGTTLVISLDLIGRARPDAGLALLGLLAVPLVLLVAVAGVCLASGLPIPWWA